MTGKWLSATLGCAAIAAMALAGCDGGSSTTTGGGGSGAGGSGAGGAETGGGMTTTTTTTTSTTIEDPCAGNIAEHVLDWKPSTGLHQNLCTETQVNDFMAGCIDPGANQADCDAFSMASAENKVCGQCIVSAPEAPAYGPITLYPDLVLLYENPGQCVSELEGDPTESSCGAKVFSTIQCTIEACSKCTGVTFETLLQCLTSAEAGDCKRFAVERDTCLADLATKGVDVDVCLNKASDTAGFYTYLRSLALLGCGP